MLKAPRSRYYDWHGRPGSPTELRNKELAKMIREIHRDSRGSYGSPRVRAEQRLGKGMEVNRKRVERLMREADVQGICRRRGRKNLVSAATEEDLVYGAFTVDAPDRLWLTDISEHPTADWRLYAAAVLDAFSRLIIGWSVAERQATDLVVNVLAMAVTRRQPEKNSTILHSDHGTWAVHILGIREANTGRRPARIHRDRR